MALCIVVGRRKVSTSTAQRVWPQVFLGLPLWRPSRTTGQISKISPPSLPLFLTLYTFVRFGFWRYLTWASIGSYALVYTYPCTLDTSAARSIGITKRISTKGPHCRRRDWVLFWRHGCIYSSTLNIPLFFKNPILYTIDWFIASIFWRSGKKCAQRNTWKVFLTEFFFFFKKSTLPQIPPLVT